MAQITDALKVTAVSLIKVVDPEKGTYVQLGFASQELQRVIHQNFFVNDKAKGLKSLNFWLNRIDPDYEAKALPDLEYLTAFAGLTEEQAKLDIDKAAEKAYPVAIEALAKVVAERKEFSVVRVKNTYKRSDNSDQVYQYNYVPVFPAKPEAEEDDTQEDFNFTETEVKPAKKSVKKNE